MLFEWTVPPECPNEQVVTAQVTALAGETLAQQPLSVRARVIAGREHLYRLELFVGREGDARVIESDDCQKLADATALIVSLDLQSRAHSQSAKRPKRPTSKPQARMRPTPAQSTERFARTMHGGLGVNVSGDRGTLPEIAWGAGVHGYIRYGAFRGELGAMLWPRSRAIAATPLGGGVSIWLHTIALTGCLTWLPRIELMSCLRAEGGNVRAVGFGISRPATSNGAWFAGFVGITARLFMWDTLAPRVSVEVGAPVRYGAVEIERVGQVYAPSPVLFRFGIGVETKLF